MDFGGNSSRCRIVGDYEIGPKIGSGSFAVVWRSKHRRSGIEYAIKEIDKKHLNDNLLKEIEILRNICHPNIIRLYEAIETEERIYLVLEYCDGGDLGAYAHRHGNISIGVVRHFLKQLAAGLQVLRENHLIHRDLKPQNLLLYGKEMTPMLKIGDFGFARYLTPQGLADTLCGSPLYMAPEIIQNQRYDAKADLWSVGAILYQLVIGKPPFHGNNQLQLFQNILRSTELRFPEDVLKALDPNFVELCRGLLRRNPVERLTFEEFFNHRFMKDSRDEDAKSSLVSQVEPSVLTDGQRFQLHQVDKLKPPEGRGEQCFSVNDEQRDLQKHCYRTPSGNDVSAVIPNTSDKIIHSFEERPYSSSNNRVADSSGSIENDYVLVHSNFASMEIFTSSLGTSREETSVVQPCALATKISDQQTPSSVETMEEAAKCIDGIENVSKSRTVSSSTWCSPCMIREARGPSVLHPSTRLQLLHQYPGALSDIAQDKLNAGSFLESFSVELLVLALWKEAFRICSSWLSSRGGGNLPECSMRSEFSSATANYASQEQGAPDFSNPSSVSVWAEQGFILACDRTEKLSKHFQGGDDSTQMPDAIEIIYQSALTAGRNGAADELIGNQDSAATMYSKALLLFSFIVEEASSLQLNPPFFLAEENKKRILKYIKSLESHLNYSLMSQPPKLPSFLTK